MKIERVYFAPLAVRMMRFAAIEHRNRKGNLLEASAELLGYTLGDHAHIDAIYPYGKVEFRTRGQVKIADEESESAWDYFDDLILGDFHTHPEELLEDYPDGSLMVICGVWPRKRGGYSYKWKVYGSHMNQVYRAKEVFL